jgi:hypothetical protein
MWHCCFGVFVMSRPSINGQPMTPAERKRLQRRDFVYISLFFEKDYSHV